MEKVVIIDLMNENKIGPYEHPKVLAERAALKNEIKVLELTPVIYEQYKKTESERTVLKSVKKEWNKIKTNLKEREALVREIISGRVPNWGAIKVSLCNR